MNVLSTSFIEKNKSNKFEIPNKSNLLTQFTCKEIYLIYFEKWVTRHTLRGNVEGKISDLVFVLNLMLGPKVMAIMTVTMLSKEDLDYSCSIEKKIEKDNYSFSVPSEQT